MHTRTSERILACAAFLRLKPDPRLSIAVYSSPCERYVGGRGEWNKRNNRGSKIIPELYGMLQQAMAAAAAALTSDIVPSSCTGH